MKGKMDGNKSAETFIYDMQTIKMGKMPWKSPKAMDMKNGHDLTMRWAQRKFFFFYSFVVPL